MLFHVWFSTKQRKWLLQGELVDAAKELMRETSSRKGIDLIECEAVVDHVHLLLDVPAATELPRAMNMLKGAPSRGITQRFPEWKLDAGAAHFWQAGYASKIIPPRSRAVVQRYIRTQWERLEDYDR